MRNVWIGLVLAGAAGCSTQAVTFEHQSELETNTRGVALLDDGLRGQAGMYGTTCRVNLTDASIGEDEDFSSEEELVVEGGTILGEPAVLVLSDLGAHLTYPNGGFGVYDNYENPNVVDGAIYDEGIVVLLNDGAVQWVNDGVVTAVPAVIDSPAYGIAVTPSGTVFVGTSAGVITVDAGGTPSTVADAADIVVWDDVAGVLYTATSGTPTLSGIELDGNVRWTTELSGNITAVDAMGPLAQAAVMVENPSGTGELVTVDGFTGGVTSSLTTPGTAEALVMSGNGKSMALVLGSEVHFFNVRGTP